jgi:thiopurine S-methyltransferase
MDPAFWRTRWAEHKVHGFHEGHPNAFLAANLARLDGYYRVLVPLCGKAEDLAFLAANNHAVVGVELVEDAAAQFFAEHAIEPKVERREDHAIYTAHELTVITGDWFAMTPTIVGPVDAVYDRAALIALPPELRPRYIAQLRTLVPAGAWGLTVTLDYGDAAFQGPPFSVSDAEVRGHYKAVELLGEAPNPNGRLADAGIAATERCYAVQIW